MPTTESFIRPGLYVKKLGEKGNGVFTRHSIAKDERIGIAAGGVIVSSEKIEHLRKKIGDHAHQVADDFHWAPKNRGDIDTLDLMNHSCDPNVAILGDMTFVALGDIGAGEELTWDYATTESDPTYGFPCTCGAVLCRQTLTGNDWKSLDFIKRYYPLHVSPYLARRMEAYLKEEHLDVQGGKLYFVDTFGVWAYHELARVLVSTHSQFAHIQICETVKHGKALALDGSPQISVSDGPVYTELLVCAALLCHPSPEVVVIVGGGDGAALAAVLRDPRVKKVVLIDIDPLVIELTQAFMPELWEAAAGDERVTIVSDDALHYLVTTDIMADLIISDLIDPGERTAASHLMKAGYFQALSERLHPNGIITIQSGEYTMHNNSGMIQTKKLLQEYVLVGSHGSIFSLGVHVPWFSNPWSIIIASRRPLHDLRYIDTVSNLFGLKPYLTKHFRYLTPETLVAAVNYSPAVAEAR